MKKSLVIALMLCLIAPCIAEEKFSFSQNKNLPQGTFKKLRNGTIVQYDKNGKKVGKYKLDNGRYYRLK